MNKQISEKVAHMASFKFRGMVANHATFQDICAFIRVEMSKELGLPMDRLDLVRPRWVDGSRVSDGSVFMCDGILIRDETIHIEGVVTDG